MSFFNSVIDKYLPTNSLRALQVSRGNGGSIERSLIASTTVRSTINRVPSSMDKHKRMQNLCSPSWQTTVLYVRCSSSSRKPANSTTGHCGWTPFGGRTTNGHKATSRSQTLSDAPRTSPQSHSFMTSGLLSELLEAKN